jgi:hypothetical protein
MIYDAQKDRFTISPSDLRRAGLGFLYALRKIRETAGLPLDRYERDAPLSAADHAMKGVIDAAKAVGIDLGGEWGNEIDVRKS